MKLLAISPLLLTSLSLITPATAQNSVLRVKVPFAFVAGDVALPAGHYEVQYEPARRWLILVSEGATYMAHLNPSVVDYSSSARPASRLVFHKFGEEYFLNQLTFGTISLTCTFPPAKAERTRLKKVPFEIATFKPAGR